MLKGLGNGIKFIQTSVSADPQYPGKILMNISDIVTTQTSRIGGIVLKLLKATAGTVEPVQPIPRADLERL